MRFFRWLLNLPDPNRKRTMHLCLDEGYGGHLIVAIVDVSRQDLQNMLQDFEKTDTLVFRVREES